MKVRTHRLPSLFVYGIACACFLLAVPWLLQLLGNITPTPWGARAHVSQASGNAQQLRVLNLPCDMGENDWMELLRQLEVHGFKPPKSSPLAAIKSSTDAIDDSSCMATLQVSRADQKIHDAKASGSIRLRGREIPFDAEFRNLTPLHWSQGWIVDIVAVTGLGGRPIGSWQGRHGMWLRDWLGQDLMKKERDARIFTYGYPSKVVERGRDTSLSEYAQVALDNMAYARRAQLEAGVARPLILIVHSSGGLIIKEALIMAEKSNKQAYRDILDSCVCIVMFSVPNLGLNNTSFMEMTEDQENHELMRDLGEGSPYLEKLDQDFKEIVDSRNIKIVAVYETANTPSFEKVGDSGTWNRSGPDVRSVRRESAVSPGLGENVETIVSYSNHVEIAKLESPADHVYLQVADHIATAAGNANRDLARSKFINVPTKRAEIFVGGQYLVDIHRHLTSNNRLGVGHGRVFVIRGGPGMGKTETALQYASTYAGAYSKIVWIRAGSELEIFQSFRSVVETLRIEDSRDPQITTYDPEIAVDLALTRLSQANQRVLLVYDGLDKLSPSVIAQHRQKWHSSMGVIVTTSYDIPMSQEDGSIILKGIEPHGGVDLLRKLLEPEFQDMDATLHAFGQAVGWSPIAVVVIPSLLKAQRYPVATLLDIWKNSPMLFLDEGTSPCSSIQNCVVISVLTKHLEGFRQDASTYASTFLNLCSFLGPKVDYSLLELAYSFHQRNKASGPGNHAPHLEWLFGNASWTLTQLHMELPELVEHHVLYHEENSWEQPALMSEVVRHNSGDPETLIVDAAYLIHAAAEEVRKQESGGARRDTRSVYYAQLPIVHYPDTLVAFCQHVLKKNIATIVPLEYIITFATWNVHARKYPLAIDMLKAGIKQHTARSDDFADVREIVNNARRVLAWALRSNGQLEEAMVEQECAIGELRDSLSKHGNEISSVPELVRAQGELASIFRDRGRRDNSRDDFNSAITLQKKAIRQATEIFGEAHSETLHERSCLSTIYTWANMRKESLDEDKMILHLSASNLPRSPTSRQMSEHLKKMRHVGEGHYDCGEYDKAKPVEMELVKQTRELRGDRHIETAEALYNLGMSCYAASKSGGWAEVLRRLVTHGSLTNISLYQAQQAAGMVQELLGWVKALYQLMTHGSWADISLDQAQEALGVWQALLGWVKALPRGSWANSDLDLALESIKEAASIWEELLGENHDLTKKAYKEMKKMEAAYR